MAGRTSDHQCIKFVLRIKVKSDDIDCSLNSFAKPITLHRSASPRLPQDVVPDLLNLYLLMELVQLCSLWRIQASLGQLVIACFSVGQAKPVIAHCNALVGQAGSVIVSWMVGWLVKLSRLLSVHLIPTTMLFCRHGTTWYEAIIATPYLASHHVR